MVSSRAERKVRRQIRNESRKGLRNNNNNNQRYRTYKTPLTYEARQHRKKVMLGGLIVMVPWITIVAVLSAIL